MKKSGRIQKLFNAPKPELKTKSDAVYSQKKTSKKSEKLGDSEQADRQDSGQIEK